MKVLMLDIDDVVNSDRALAACTGFTERGSWKIPRVGDQIGLGLVQRACRHSCARIVVISTWISVVGWSFTLDWLVQTGLDQSLLHPDPCVRYGPSGRKVEAVVDWMVQNRAKAHDIVVVDDDANLFPRPHPLRRRQVVITGRDGILLRHFRQIVRMLGRAEKSVAGRSSTNG